MSQSELVVRIPGYSSASIADILDGLPSMHEGVSLSTSRPKAGLGMEPAIVAVLVSSATVLTTEVIRSVVLLYLDHKKRLSEAPSEKEQSVQLRIELALGTDQAATICDEKQLDQALKELPQDKGPIVRINLEN